MSPKRSKLPKKLKMSSSNTNKNKISSSSSKGEKNKSKTRRLTKRNNHRMPKAMPNAMGNKSHPKIRTAPGRRTNLKNRMDKETKSSPRIKGAKRIVNRVSHLLMLPSNAEPPPVKVRTSLLP